MLDQGVSRADAIAQSMGGSIVLGGLWRIYSNAWPEGGVAAWNAESSWRGAWRQFLPAGLWAFGEDVFGDQLCLLDGVHEVQLWNHEDATLASLEADPVTLFGAVLEQGLDWLDAYACGSLDAARSLPPVDRAKHLHWRTPLILGGVVSASNLEPIERECHLVGHAALWRQVRELPPGAEFIAE